MSYFTDVFHALDYENKGYILINDFKNAMKKYLRNADNTVDADSEKTLNKFKELVKMSEDGKIYFDDFIYAVNECNYFVNGPKVEENVHRELSHDSEFSPFVNEFENCSTGDSGLDNEGRGGHDLNNSGSSGVGKKNRKLIKRFQQIEGVQGKEILGQRLSLNELNNCDCTKPLDFQVDFNLPADDLNSGFIGCIRQSDFITCENRRMNQKKKYDRDEDTYSLNIFTPYSGSAADLFYHDSMTDIHKKLENLERSMDNLHNISVESKNIKRKHVDESYILVGQIQSLEEKVRDLQKQFETDLYTERESARRNLIKLEKAKFEEIDYLNWSIKTKEEDLEAQRREYQNVISCNERMKFDKLRSEDRLLDLQQQMTSIEQEMRRLKDYHCKELEVVMKVKDFDGRRYSNHEIGAKQKDISRLKLENTELKRKLEECETEMLALSVQHGQNILQLIPSDDSWLTEVDGYTKDELINLLVKEKDGNFRLREYVSKILTRIIDKDPSLLEIS